MSCCCADEALLEAGTVVRLSLTLTSAEVLLDAATILVRVKDPLGVRTVLTPTHDSLGKYHVDVSVPTAGQWFYRWESVAPTGVQEGSFIVSRSQVL